MPILEKTTDAKNVCPDLCKYCADKKNKQQGKKKIPYCRFSGLCLKEAIKDCPYN